MRDGFFPDAVFADPRFVMPVINAALDEWLDGKPSSATAFFSSLAGYGGLAAQVARGATALEAMMNDKSCLRFLTVSGAMTDRKSVV